MSAPILFSRAFSHRYLSTISPESRAPSLEPHATLERQRIILYYGNYCVPSFTSLLDPAAARPETCRFSLTLTVFCSLLHSTETLSPCPLEFNLCDNSKETAWPGLAVLRDNNEDGVRLRGMFDSKEFNAHRDLSIAMTS